MHAPGSHSPHFGHIPGGVGDIAFRQRGGEHTAGPELADVPELR